ncbi:MAG: molybdenum cofactor guanylyltransferase [Candidatus Lokiarchaeota archaeon]|nr:molybdenum cofactor guanylyltransferase [Candidatus Lokiarchaeota archaeon]
MPATKLPASLGLVILAGGASRRFRGGQKALVDLGGQNIGNLLLGGLAPAFTRTYLSVRNDDQARALVSGGIQLPETASFVLDLASFPGNRRDDAAIFGLYSTFFAVREPFALVISVDMPFVTPAVAWMLADHLPGDPDAVVPRWGNGFIEPTLAIYKVAPAISRIEEMLVARQYQLVELVKGLKVVVHLPIEQLKRVDPGLASIVNVNSELDLDLARQIYEGRAGKA